MKLHNPSLRAFFAAAAIFLTAGAATTLILGGLSCGTRAPTASDLAVTTYSPMATSAPGEALQLQFDQPVVEDGQVGEPLAAPPVKIQPAAKVSAHWRDRQTLVITPAEAMKPSTRYTVALSGELSARTGGFSFSFVHEPLVVEGIWGVDLMQLPAKPTLPIRFNQEVRVKDVIAGCRLQEGSKAIALVAAEGAGDGDTVPLTPGQALEQDRDYEITCDGIKGAGGDAPMVAAYVQPLHTYAKFTVKAWTPLGTDVPADDLDIELELSTPVTLEELRRHLSATPAIAGLDQGWLDRSGTRYKATVNLKAMTQYAITLSADLVDSFGQTLEKPFRASFTSGTARPRMSVETGIYALEVDSPGYPVWTRNVKDIDVSCAVVPRNKIVGLLTSALDYDPWYDASESRELDWSALGLSRRAERITLKQPKDNWELTSLAMHETCKSGKKRGLFLVELASPDVKPDPNYYWRHRPNRRVLANVTDLGLLLKAGTASGLVWVAEISTGQPVSGASVTLYTPAGRLAFRGRTDASGILRTPGTAEILKEGAGERIDEEWAFHSHRAQRIIAVVERGDDMAVVDGNWSNGIQTWNFGVREERGSSARNRIRGFIQSDRGIYRPGETVHFKGLVREIAIGRAPALPRQTGMNVVVTDSRGQNVLERALKLSAFGGFAFDLPLTTEANLGDYHVRATIAGQTFRERFTVEEFRPVSFEIDLASAARHNRLREKLGFDVKASYLFGAPVAGAAIEWSVQRRDHVLRFPAFPQYGFGDQAERWYSYDWHDEGSYLSYISDGTGTTDPRGRYRFSVRDPGTGLKGPQDYVVGVAVKDEADQTVSKRVVVTAHTSDFYLGLHTQEYVQAVDMPFAVNTVAVSPAGERVATRATLKFIRQTYVCEHRGSFRAYTTCRTEHELELERAIDIPAHGESTERIMPKKPGEYVVRLEATDSRGAEVVSTGSVWVIGRGEAFWSGDESARMGLIASKDSYLPGETARLVPRTSLQRGTALVTIERDGIIDAFVRTVDSSGIEIPLSDAHAPNVFASVAMISGRTGEGDRHRPRFQMGVTELTVSAERQRLDVTVETDKQIYEPGEAVSGVVRVTANGQPVSAEVSVSVADEGVLQLIAYKTPDPMNTFYASWGLGVDSATTWNRIARLNDPNVGDPDEGGDSGPGGEDRVRSNFVSSAFWEPSLVTDERGEVRFSFTAPDNLTAFRAMAVAADTGSRFGSGEQRLTVKKALLARPVLPRFLNTGDQATVGVVVHNHTGAAGTATVSAKVQGARLSQESRTVRLEADGSARASFSIRVGKSREATFEFAVQMGEHRDALRLTVPVHRPLLKDTSLLASAVAGQGGAETVTIPVSWDPSLVANHSVLSVTVDRTGLGELEPSLRYLIEYPYGCLEQTLSRFIPLTKVKDLAESLSLKELEGDKLDRFIRAGVAKVARHQRPDGHFSLWPGGETYPHLTVYALYGLVEAQRAGVAVPASVVESAVSALKRWAAGKSVVPGGDSATMAMTAYVLAEVGQPDAGLNTRLFEARRALPHYGKAFLLRAMKRARARQSDMNTLKDELVAAASMDGVMALIRESGDLGRYMSSDTRSSAITLSALLEVDRQHEMVERLVAGLKKSQRPGGGWQNTQDNLYALVALADYARSEAGGSELVTLSINGKEEVRRRLRGSRVLVLRRYLHNYKPGTLNIETSGRVRYDVRLTAAREELADTPVDRGFAVSRAYLDPQTGEPLTQFKAGQLVKVRVEVRSPAARRYVAVEDPLPAGFEAVNTRLATSSATGRAEARSTWGWTHQEMRDDRVLAFADNMHGGVAVLEYLARATLPGTFTAPPTRVEEMYSPDVLGRGTSTPVAIRK